MTIRPLARLALAAALGALFALRRRARRGPAADLSRGAWRTTRRSPRRRRTGRRRRRPCRRRAPACCRRHRRRRQRRRQPATTRPSTPIRRPISRIAMRSTTRSYRRRSRCIRSQNIDRARPGEAAGRAVGLRARARAAGPHRARRDRLFRRAARRSSTSSSPPASRRPRSRSSWRRRSAISRSASRRSPTPTRRRPSTTRSSRRRSRRKTTSTTRSTALRAIIGRFPKELKRVGPRLRRPSRRCPTTLEYWVERSLHGQSPRPGRAQRTSTSPRCEIDRAKARPLPDARPRRELPVLEHSRRHRSALGIQQLLDRRASSACSSTVPIYQGGFVDSQVRQAIALQDKARQDLEFARRTAFTLAQTGFAGVTSAVASVKAFEQALVSAEVGVRVEQPRPGSRRAHQSSTC